LRTSCFRAVAAVRRHSKKQTVRNPITYSLLAQFGGLHIFLGLSFCFFGPSKP
jgi:hypothetical protein